MPHGVLYLVPNVIAENTQGATIPPQVLTVLNEVRIFLAEDVRTARRYLSSLKIYPSIEALEFQVLNKDTTESQAAQMLKPLLDGQNVGIISESGVPGVADPGAVAVAWAHQNRVRVVPLVGPSSLLLALMASGLNGQRFAFHGYLPIDQKAAADEIRVLERESRTRNQTQIFIETPYRNNQLFSLLLKTLQHNTLLTVALEITGKDETILTQSIGSWLTNSRDWPKSPAIFMFLAPK